MKPDQQEHVPTSVLGLNSKSPGPATMTSAKRTWNTDKLGLRLSSDALSAACAGALVAPLISIIDRYVFSLYLSSSNHPVLLLAVKINS